MLGNRNKRRVSIVLLAAILLMGFVNFFPIRASADSGSTVFEPRIVRGFNAAINDNIGKAKDFGANVVRLQLIPRNEAVNSNISIAEAWQKQLNKLESAIKEVAKKGMTAVIDMHNFPYPDSVSMNSSAFWDNDANLTVLINSWEEVVQRFAPYRNYIYGYDLLNEPYNQSELPLGASKWPIWAQQVVDAIRVYDQTTPIIYEVSPGALPRGFIEDEWIDAGPGYPQQYQGELQLLDDSRVIYSVHMYEPHSYTHQGLGTFNQAPVSTNWPDKTTYPGMIGGTYWDKEKLREALQPVVDFQQKYHVPIYVGEFSAIRWAPGAAQYIRDSVELFEEFNWSWTYHAFMDWPGWSIEYTDMMTSDANSVAAKATEPTDRELILRAYFSRNDFLPGLVIPDPSSDLLRNGDFETDSNADGLADNWQEDSGVVTSLEATNGSQAQRIQTMQSNKGIAQEWVAVSDQKTYLLQVKIRVDQGTVRFWHYDINGSYATTGSGIVSDVSVTNSQYVTKSLQFKPPAGTKMISVRFWSNTATSNFIVDNVALYDLERVIPPNLVKNGGFDQDSNQDGLADSWKKDSSVTASLENISGSQAQRVLTSQNASGIAQEWIGVSDQHKYLIQAKVRVDQGTVRFWHYDINSMYTYTGSGIISDINSTNGQYVLKSLEFIPAAGTRMMSIRFTNIGQTTNFVVDDVMLFDLGPLTVVHPPQTITDAVYSPSPAPVTLTFHAEAFDGATVDRTEYRIVGESSVWSAVYSNGLVLTDPGTYIIGYRSIDSDNHVEWGKALLVEVVDTTAPTATVSYNTTTSTIQDVVATIIPSEPVTIKNNGGSSSQTFYFNGSFNFEFVDAAGNQGTATAVVNNIESKSKAIPGKPILSDDNGYDTGLHDGNFKVTMNMWYGDNGRIYKLYENDVLIDTKILTDDSPNVQTAVTDISGKQNGTYHYYTESTNAFGTTRSDVLTVTVTQATPVIPILSSDNWDGDGNFQVSMNMWWGTNGTTYRLYENGVLIDTQTLTNQTPFAQSAVMTVANKTAGTYEYRAELVNYAGIITSDTLIVQVI
jgi:aryl-phospho-beta-D-glucosidase BglC (GH1 family)